MPHRVRFQTIYFSSLALRVLLTQRVVLQTNTRREHIESLPDGTAPCGERVFYGGRERPDEPSDTALRHCVQAL